MSHDVQELQARLEAVERLYLRSQSDFSRVLAQRNYLLGACEELLEVFGPVETWDGRARTALAQAMGAVSRARNDR